MKNSDKPINPIFDQQGFISHQSALEIGNHETLHGLTKREYFAALAMQGMFASGQVSLNFDGVERVAKLSTAAADELLNQLDQ